MSVQNISSDHIGIVIDKMWQFQQFHQIILELSVTVPTISPDHIGIVLSHSIVIVYGPSYLLPEYKYILPTKSYSIC